MSLVGLFCVFALISGCNSLTFSTPRYSDSGEIIGRFPHHVTIGKISVDGSSKLCSGSIIHKNWILSSYQCLSNGVQYRINLRQENLAWMSAHGFSVQVGNSSVYHYPTQYDDISLLQLPVDLTFSRGLQPIALNSRRTHLENTFAVIASLPENGYALKYGMYRITENCDLFADRFLQLCTLPWGTDTKLLNERSSGSALIIDWPLRPKIVGIFSHLSENSSVVVYTRVSSYVDWINFVVPQDSVTTSTTTSPTTDPTPTTTASSVEPGDSVSSSTTSFSEQTPTTREGSTESGDGVATSTASPTIDPTPTTTARSVEPGDSATSSTTSFSELTPTTREDSTESGDGVTPSTADSSFGSSKADGITTTPSTFTTTPFEESTSSLTSVERTNFSTTISSSIRPRPTASTRESSSSESSEESREESTTQTTTTTVKLTTESDSEESSESVESSES